MSLRMTQLHNITYTQHLGEQDRENMTTEAEFVTVKALLPTIPLPANRERAAITTDRLLVRALQPSDLDALHVLRTQAEVMRWTSAGCIDESIEKTKSKLDPFLPPNDLVTANCAICLKDTGELVGIGGCHLYPGSHGWPEVGYMFRTEVWGKGFATEFLGAWLRFWSELPRTEREVRVQKEMVVGDGVVDECLIAITEASNDGSQRVLLKSGFERFREYVEVDGAKTVKLIAFRFVPKKR
jgi:RimJ/RimL family protein N-acetyltransferase